MFHGTEGWRPRRILKLVDMIRSNTKPLIVETDQGVGYMKVLDGTRARSQAIAYDYVGTHLARHLGLTTFDAAVIVLEEAVDIPSKPEIGSLAGPAFITREAQGTCWGGGPDRLRRISNRFELSGIVVLDTLIRNYDRFPPKDTLYEPNYDNLFLQRHGSRYRAVAFDHTHCFVDDLTSDDLTSSQTIEDEGVYGLFPEFVPLVRREEMDTICARLAKLEPAWVADLIGSVPNEWNVPTGCRSAWSAHICARARFVAANLCRYVFLQADLGI